MKTLSIWKRPIAWFVVLLVAPLVLCWVTWTAARRRVWAGRIYLKGGRRGIG